MLSKAQLKWLNLSEIKIKYIFMCNTHFGTELLHVNGKVSKKNKNGKKK